MVVPAWASPLPGSARAGTHPYTSRMLAFVDEWIPDRPFGPSGMTAVMASLQLQSHHPHEAVRHRHEAVEPRGLRDQHLAVIEVDDRIFRQQNLRGGLVDRLALGDIRGEPRVIERLVVLRPGDASGVL